MSGGQVIALASRQAPGSEIAPEAKAGHKLRVLEHGRRLIRENKLPSNSMRVIQYLAEVTDRKTGAAIVRVETIAERTGLSRRAVFRNLRRMTDKDVGLIKRAPRTLAGRSIANEYRLVDLRLAATAAKAEVIAAKAEATAARAEAIAARAEATAARAEATAARIEETTAKARAEATAARASAEATGVTLVARRGATSVTPYARTLNLPPHGFTPDGPTPGGGRPQDAKTHPPPPTSGPAPAQQKEVGSKKEWDDWTHWLAEEGKYRRYSGPVGGAAYDMAEEDLKEWRGKSGDGAILDALGTAKDNGLYGENLIDYLRNTWPVGRRGKRCRS